MNGKMTSFFTLWKIEDDGKKAIIQMSTGRKVREDEKSLIDNNIAKNGYVNTSWSFVNFVGKAYEKVKDLDEGTRITNVNMNINMEPYWDDKNNCVAYRRQPRFTVFDFEFPEDNQKTNFDKAPDVAPTEEEYPF